MRTFMLSFTLIFLLILLAPTVWSDVTLEVGPRTVFPHTTGNKMYLNMDNPVDFINALQTNILFNTECFTVSGINKTRLSESMDTFNFLNIEGDVQINIAGNGHQIHPGYGSIVELIVDVKNCAEGDYLWDVTESGVIDSAGWEVDTWEIDNYIHIFRCDTCIKGDVNDDGAIDVRDAVLCVNHILGLWPFEDPNRTWASDCNGPPGNCDGDGITDVLDALKIVNMILELDECLPDNVIYFNSFESEEDTIGWRWLHPEMFVDDPAPGGGRKSLFIGGGCMQPAAFLELPQQSEAGIYSMSCWGKIEEMNRAGTIYLTTNDSFDDSTTIELKIDSIEWEFLQTEESLHCSTKDTLRIEIWIGGYVPASMFIDLLKIESIE